MENLTALDTARQFRQQMETWYPDLKDNGHLDIPQNSQKFWRFYREHKTALREARLFVFRTKTGDWVLKAHPFDCPKSVNSKHSEKKTLPEDMPCTPPKLTAAVRKREMAIVEWTQRGLFDSCDRCDLPFQHHVICKSRMSNGVKQFQLFCPVCQRETTSALPHVLVPHLTEIHELRIIPKPKRWYGGGIR